MRRVVTMSIVGLMVGGAAVTAGLAWRQARARDAGRADPAPGVDPARTLSYLEDWAHRDRWDLFPESPSFAFYNVYATQALGGRIPVALRAKVVDYLKRCQGRDGGFAAAADSGASHVVPTLYALRTLALLDALDAIDRNGAAIFLRALARPGGGYAGRPVEPDAALGTTFHALAALDVLGAIDRADADATARYLSSHRTADGGFALRTGMAASPRATFMAVRSLKLLRALDDETSAAVARHLASSRYSGRLREGKFSTLPEVEEEENVLASLADLGRMDLVDRGAVERFVNGLYVAENGGFGPQPGVGTTPPSTYQAIACLVALGRLPEPPRG
ncbi:MAG: prenyltransferase/squalene oxidase repeat-containing protein [Anaeromyxobacteraceae bacterium]